MVVNPKDLIYPIQNLVIKESLKIHLSISAFPSELMIVNTNFIIQYGSDSVSFAF
jgi:hypothetical protein